MNTKNEPSENKKYFLVLLENQLLAWHAMQWLFIKHRHNNEWEDHFQRLKNAWESCSNQTWPKQPMEAPSSPNLGPK